MYCPACKNPMIVLEFEGIETDYCPDCEGIWLDTGELELLLDDSTDKTELLDSFSRSQSSKEKRRKCPICSKKMDKTFVSAERDIVLDECKYGHGIWFDKGEILEVIKRGSVNKKNRIVQILEDMYKSKIGEKDI